jgi:hypothetical protein
MDNWKNILDEDILKTNVLFAAIFVLNYECLKDYIVNEIRCFYSDHIHFEGDKVICDESQTYKDKVRSLNKNIEDASLKWFLNEGAITVDDYKTYQKIRTRRNDIIHELLKNLNNGFNEDDIKLFSDLLNIYGKIDRWWINEIEIPTMGDVVPDDYDRDVVCGGQAMLLSIINNIVFGDDGERYKDMLKELMKIWKGEAI